MQSEDDLKEIYIICIIICLIVFLISGFILTEFITGL